MGKKHYKKEIIGILLITISVFTALSFLTYDPYETPTGLSPEFARSNIMGNFGVYVSYYLMKFTFGLGAFFIPLIIFIYGYCLFSHKKINNYFKTTSYIFYLGVWISVVTGLIGKLLGAWWKVEYSGSVGWAITNLFYDIFGSIALMILLMILLMIIISGYFKFSIYSYLQYLFSNMKNRINKWKEDKEKNNRVLKNKSELEQNIEFMETDEINTDVDKENEDIQEEKNTVNNDQIMSDKIESKNNLVINELNDDLQEKDDLYNNDIEKDIEIEEEIEIDEGDLDSEKDRQAKYRQYKLPVTDYLNDPIEIGSTQSEEELKNKANHLVHSLETFGVKGRVVRISPGPIITLFEIEPDEGVRVNKFTNLSDDLARVMKAQRVRIIAPIPGSKSVGIELPNENPGIVYIKTIINSEQYIKSKSKLTISLGKTTSGEAYVFDLGKMPHLLVAGATGAGKSVCINTIIVSILYKAKPDEVKFILMDPKKVELSAYKSLESYHLITAPNIDEYVMTTPENSVGILNSAIVEMERRFQVFADARVRNISEYHIKQKDNLELEVIPYLVVIIDELADLMINSGRAVEEPITRLAQKARAVGIHLVVATQRPSVDVITGLIKSNFPSRIAFQVSSKIDSRTIIDQIGAEKLLGKGDMLFLLPGSAVPIRIHNAFITLEEIESIMTHITSQPKPNEMELPKIRDEKKEGDFNIDSNQDELLKDAAVLVIQHQQASVSLLQRRFRIGYSRAGRLIDELEALGIISGYSGSKARDVLVDESYVQNIFNE